MMSREKLVPAGKLILAIAFHPQLGL